MIALALAPRSGRVLSRAGTSGSRAAAPSPAVLASSAARFSGCPARSPDRSSPASAGYQFAAGAGGHPASAGYPGPGGHPVGASRYAATSEYPEPAWSGCRLGHRAAGRERYPSQVLEAAKQCGRVVRRARRAGAIAPHSAPARAGPLGRYHARSSGGTVVADLGGGIDGGDGGGDG
jgi:hypothetical protein